MGRKVKDWYRPGPLKGPFHKAHQAFIKLLLLSVCQALFISLMLVLCSQEAHSLVGERNKGRDFIRGTFSGRSASGSWGLEGGCPSGKGGKSCQLGTSRSPGCPTTFHSPLPLFSKLSFCSQLCLPLGKPSELQSRRMRSPLQGRRGQVLQIPSADAVPSKGTWQSLNSSTRSPFSVPGPTWLHMQSPKPDDETFKRPGPVAPMPEAPLDITSFCWNSPRRVHTHH